MNPTDLLDILDHAAGAVRAGHDLLARQNQAHLLMADAWALAKHYNAQPDDGPTWARSFEMRAEEMEAESRRLLDEAQAQHAARSAGGGPRLVLVLVSGADSQDEAEACVAFAMKAAREHPESRANADACRRSGLVPIVAKVGTVVPCPELER